MGWEERETHTIVKTRQVMKKSETRCLLGRKKVRVKKRMCVELLS
jgi:hypothetical protein